MKEADKIKQFILNKKRLIFILAAILPLAYLFLVFYFYAFNIEAGLSESGNEISIDRKLREKVMADFRQREINFAQEPNKVYFDPFNR